jgi:hypothetical protein
MTTPHDVGQVSESLAFPPKSLDEDAGALSLFQEINERRARVENAELLQNLRSL